MNAPALGMGAVLRNTGKTALTSMGGPGGLVASTAPTVAFTAVALTSSLPVAAIATTATALAALTGRLIAGEPLRQAPVGIAVAAACITLSLVTGRARDFFLVPVLIPLLAITICLGSIAIRRPLSGVLLNRLAGGPPGWRTHPRLLRVHTLATLGFAGINVVNLCVQVWLYRTDELAWLAAANIVSPILFALAIAATIITARGRRPDLGSPDRGETAPTGRNSPPPGT
ncbi:MAG TPA: DUF3159 domain-containing protein [Pseudonocardia sp.]|jgi:hypothetical protein|nr:DUF3159 domain-containing protein [Pseudonocardia sp.]